VGFFDFLEKASQNEGTMFDQMMSSHPLKKAGDLINVCKNTWLSNY